MKFLKDIARDLDHHLGGDRGYHGLDMTHNPANDVHFESFVFSDCWYSLSGFAPTYRT